MHVCIFYLYVGLPGISNITVSDTCLTTPVNISWNQLSISTSYCGEITFSDGGILFINILSSES